MTAHAPESQIDQYSITVSCTHPGCTWTETTVCRFLPEARTTARRWAWEHWNQHHRPGKDPIDQPK